MKYIGCILKLDKWLTNKITEESWLSVIVNVGAVAIGYSGFYWLPEIALFFGGDPTPPWKHAWHLNIAKIFSSIILIFTFLKVIRLMRKFKQPAQGGYVDVIRRNNRGQTELTRI